jgi:hypothetical protein
MEAPDRELLRIAQGVQTHRHARRQDRSKLRLHNPYGRRRDKLPMNRRGTLMRMARGQTRSPRRLRGLSRTSLTRPSVTISGVLTAARIACSNQRGAMEGVTFSTSDT